LITVNSIACATTIGQTLTRANRRRDVAQQSVVNLHPDSQEILLIRASHSSVASNDYGTAGVADLITVAHAFFVACTRVGKWTVEAAPHELVIPGERDSRSCIIKDGISSRSTSVLMTVTRAVVPSHHPWTNS
jgi:hypothetical protein